MPIMISIPDDCKPLADAVRHLVAKTEQARERARGGRAVEYAQVERDVGAATAAVERAAHQSILAAFDLDVPAVVIEGQVHRRVCRSEGRYYTLAVAAWAILLWRGVWRITGLLLLSRGSHSVLILPILPLHRCAA